MALFWRRAHLYELLHVLWYVSLCATHSFSNGRVPSHAKALAKDNLVTRQAHTGRLLHWLLLSISDQVCCQLVFFQVQLYDFLCHLRIYRLPEKILSFSLLRSRPQFPISLLLLKLLLEEKVTHTRRRLLPHLCCLDILVTFPCRRHLRWHNTPDPAVMPLGWRGWQSVWHHDIWLTTSLLCTAIKALLRSLQHQFLRIHLLGDLQPLNSLLLCFLLLLRKFAKVCLALDLVVRRS